MNIEFIKRVPVYFLLICLGVVSCTIDEEKDPFEGYSPEIVFDEESGIYTVKVNKTVVVSAVVNNAVNPVYSWKHEGKIVGTESSYSFLSIEAGSYYHTFRVDADNGSVQQEVRIDVVELAPPVISLPVDDDGYILAVTGEALELAPLVKFSEGAGYSWILEGEEVSTAEVYHFLAGETGDYRMELVVTNEDGKDSVRFTVRVTEPPVLTLVFDRETLSVPSGKMLLLAPQVLYRGEGTIFEWLVDGVLQEEKGERLAFTPALPGEYLVSVTGKEKDKEAIATVKVRCTEAEGTYYVAATSTSSPYSTVVYEYLPAPGQFINGIGTQETMAEACAFAHDRLERTAYVSLGGFGGYIVVGFDHSIDNTPGANDFAIYGNAFSGGSEPGVVWVMQDENGNGLPDDTWYELRGSETGNPLTISNYAVTYYKPSGAGMDVQWMDNYGNKGTVDYMAGFHSQSYYYPAWVTTRSYTLKGTCLPPNSYLGEDGYWYNRQYEWGYADNLGSDIGNSENEEVKANPNYFRIDNAMHPDGTPVKLEYIDFIKVQTGQNGKAGPLGELSTEVLKFEDLKLTGK